MALFGVQTTGIDYLGIDPVSGRYRYYNLDTGLSSFSDTPPTAAQQEQYRQNQALENSQDNAEVPLKETNAAPPTAVTDPNALSASEAQNLTANNQSNNPDAGEAVKTGLVKSETALADAIPQSDTNNLDSSNANANNPNAPTTPSSSNPDTPNLSTPLPNRLKDYASYIYGLSWHLLSQDDYNQTVQKQTYTPKNVLVASAGRYSPDTFPRNSHFNEDFYFDDLTMDTIVHPNDISRNTNAVDGTFTLIEPYGFTLVERLLEASKDVQSLNYLENPYLLQIDFYAIDDTGNIVGSIEELRKRIPIHIRTMDVNITVRGAEYKIGFVPFNHTAYDSSNCTTPANFEITASTVANFFQSIEGSAADTVLAENQVRESVQSAAQPTNSANTTKNKLNAGAVVTNPANNPKPNNTSSQQSQAAIYNKVSSYGSAINKWNEVLLKYNKISVQDTYRFEFPKVTLEDGKSVSIGDYAFTDQLRISPKETQMTNNLTPKDVAIMKRANLGETFKKPTTTTPTTTTPTPAPTYTSGVVDQTYFVKAPGESDSAYAKRMKDYAIQENAKAASAKATSNAIAGSVDQTYFIKAPGESDAAYAKRMQDYAVTQNARQGVTTTIPTSSTPAPSTALYDSTRALFQVQAGTTIERLLDYIIRNSDYIQNQLIVPDDQTYEERKTALKDKPLYWYKIVPTVQLISFDVRRRVWAREITYTVTPYTIYNLRSSLGPQGVSTRPVKAYNYIYTGLNDDILNFDIKFNFLYFNQVTAYGQSLAAVAPTVSQAVADGQYPNFNNFSGQGTPPGSLDGTNSGSVYDSVMPLVYRPVVQNSRGGATGGAMSRMETAAIDLEASLMINSQADMVNVKLKIIGDPDYIKQDDVFYRPPLEGTDVAIKPSSDPRLTPLNGSLAFDKGAQYVQLLFRVPTDIDESTGLMKFDAAYKNSLFSGLYGVVKVHNSFHHGEFSQELELVRLSRQQAFDYINNQNNSSDNRAETAGQTTDKLGISTPPVLVSKVDSNGANPPSPADAVDQSSGGETAGQSTEAAKAQANTESVVTPDQKDLMNVNESAPEGVINDNNEPQAIVPNFTPISIRGNQVPGQAAVTG
jgi:hypothetical protein